MCEERPVPALLQGLRFRGFHLAQDPFSPRTGHGHMDIGLVKDTDNNLLPYYFQMNRSTPMTIKGYHLEGL